MATTLKNWLYGRVARGVFDAQLRAFIIACRVPTLSEVFMTTFQLILVRHGQSTWNLENRFTGWTDVDLTELGRREALAGAQLMIEQGFSFDLAFTSVLKRAIKTLWIIQEAMELEWIPVTRAWQLNERSYGALQGLNKAEIAQQYGEAQVKVWRRSYDVPPPP